MPQSSEPLSPPTSACHCLPNDAVWGCGTSLGQSRQSGPGTRGEAFYTFPLLFWLSHWSSLNLSFLLYKMGRGHHLASQISGVVK